MAENKEFNPEKLVNLSDQLSDEEKKGNVGKIIFYVTSAIQNGWTFAKAFNTFTQLNEMNDHVAKLDRLLDRLVKSCNSNDEIVQRAKEFHTKNSTASFSNFDFVLDLTKDSCQSKLAKTEGIKQQILDAFKNRQRSECNKAMTNMVTANAIVAGIQLVKIYMAWKTISAASNVTKDKNKFTLINKNLENMEKMVMEFVEICTSNPEDKSIDRRMTRINALFTSTLGKINTLTVTINGHIQRLDLLQDYAAADAVLNTVSTASQCLQLWGAFENLSTPSKWLGAASVAVTALVGLADVRIFLVTKDTLEELRKDFKEAKYLQEILEDLHLQAEQAIPQ